MSESVAETLDLDPRPKSVGIYVYILCGLVPELMKRCTRIHSATCLGLEESLSWSQLARALGLPWLLAFLGTAPGQATGAWPRTILLPASACGRPSIIGSASFPSQLRLATKSIAVLRLHECSRSMGPRPVRCSRPWSLSQPE